MRSPVHIYVNLREKKAGKEEETEGKPSVYVSDLLKYVFPFFFQLFRLEVLFPPLLQGITFCSGFVEGLEVGSVQNMSNSLVLIR